MRKNYTNSKELICNGHKYAQVEQSYATGQMLPGKNNVSKNSDDSKN